VHIGDPIALLFRSSSKLFELPRITRTFGLTEVHMNEGYATYEEVDSLWVVKLQEQAPPVKGPALAGQFVTEPAAEQQSVLPALSITP
jgi:hypothetical protein